ncbi:hypothetical protein DERA104750_14600 [Deinococcus radiodurans]|uniref:hypothetical protein n=1 Tax=Deinococcus radiodurans TaxID=1299 RepID=UPI00068DA8BC|nr:hypothetical protein [Deinococcus radiodurans]ANC72291.1 hypothetical protein A2G07_11230 [Deinococcus radiodurans R1 = ATCC 13939 = DSM 20539]UID69462.1 hypothetical protein DRO_0457 [Deinococcus radiodurans R1 = ATCC 13939 = DSM 20539]
MDLGLTSGRGGSGAGNGGAGTGETGAGTPSASRPGSGGTGNGSGTGEGSGTVPASGRGTGGSGTGTGNGGGAGEGAGVGAVARGGGGAGQGAGNETRPLTCTVVVDVRGLGKLESAMTSFVMDSAGNQVWPDAELIKGVATQLVQEGNLQEYTRSEAGLAQLKNVTRVKASRLLRPKQSPGAPYFADVELSADAAQTFRSAGKACKVVYLRD